MPYVSPYSAGDGVWSHWGAKEEGPEVVTTPKLVLLPGLDGTGDLFKSFTREIEADFTFGVVRYCSPEVSSYAECTAVAEHALQGSAPFVLVGESFSGPVAVSIAARSPPGLLGLVLVGSFVEAPRLAFRWLSPFIGMLPAHNGSSFLSDFLLMGRWATPELRQRVADALAQVSLAAVRTRLREIAHVDVSAELSKIRTPVLYLRATHDRLVPRSAGDRIVSLAPHTKVLEIEAPHMLLQCAPAECARLIGDFARRCETAVRGYSTEPASGYGRPASSMRGGQ
jgi:pimeloyl-[acyl-carrier protein] methyl ester esterase